LPAWLAALENEVQYHMIPKRMRDPAHSMNIEPPTPAIAFIREQLEQLTQSDG
jgi:hypothetical protein